MKCLFLFGFLLVAEEPVEAGGGGDFGIGLSDAIKQFSGNLALTDSFRSGLKLRCYHLAIGAFQC